MSEYAIESEGETVLDCWIMGVNDNRAEIVLDLDFFGTLDRSEAKDMLYRGALMCWKKYMEPKGEKR